MKDTVKNEKSLSEGDLIDMNAKDFEEFCKDKDIGYLSGLRNLFAAQYEVVKTTKDALIKKSYELKKQGKEEQTKKTLDGLYLNLFKLEQKYCLCNQIIRNRHIS